MTVEDLIEYWKRLGEATVHPLDTPYITIDGFATELIPVPWVGPIFTAQVYFLFLNPGLDPQDASYEKNRPDFTKALRQNLDGREPYLYLQNRFVDHPGNTWARTTFGKDLTNEDLSQFCALELVPYHSRSGGVARAVSKVLPSSLIMQQFVREVLVPRSQRKEIGLIIARSENLWQLPNPIEGENLVIYRGWECRRARQTPNTRGGRLFRSLIG